MSAFWHKKDDVVGEQKSMLQLIYILFLVSASAAFVPEFSNLQDESEKFMFAYSIRLSLSPDGCIINGMALSSCQLYWRRWIIHANDFVVDNLNGEAVIGKAGLCAKDGNKFE